MRSIVWCQVGFPGHFSPTSATVESADMEKDEESGRKRKERDRQSVFKGLHNVVSMDKGIGTIRLLDREEQPLEWVTTV